MQITLLGLYLIATFCIDMYNNVGFKVITVIAKEQPTHSSVDYINYGISIQYKLMQPKMEGGSLFLTY